MRGVNLCTHTLRGRPTVSGPRNGPGAPSHAPRAGNFLHAPPLALRSASQRPDCLRRVTLCTHPAPPHPVPSRPAPPMQLARHKARGPPAGRERARARGYSGGPDLAWQRRQAGGGKRGHQRRNQLLTHRNRPQQGPPIRAPSRAPPRVQGPCRAASGARAALRDGRVAPARGSRAPVSRRRGSATGAATHAGSSRGGGGAAAAHAYTAALSLRTDPLHKAGGA
jgi:hypothetical protein